MNLAQAFRDQATSCNALGSPFMARLLTLLADHWPEETVIARKFAAFDGDIGPAGHSLPLRLAGGLHALRLSGQAPTLAAVYPPHDPSDDALRAAVLGALSDHAAFLDQWTDSPPQTNEVRRSAVLIAGARVAVKTFPLPIKLSELGASGGLNLMWDHYALDAAGTLFGPDDPVLTLSPEWSGPMPPDTHPVIAERAGADLAPLDPQKPGDLLRLTAYLWPDQPERLRLTRAAATVMNAPIAQQDAIDWLQTRLAAPRSGQLHLIQHSVAWQYFPRAVQERGTDLIEAAGAQAREDRPLAWLAMESDGDTKGQKGAAITLRLWPGDVTLHLGRADFHGRWINWTFEG